MNIWYAIPSARPAAEANAMLDQWRRLGYRIAVYLNPVSRMSEIDANLKIATEDYHGYGRAVNDLVRVILEKDPDAEWIVTGGDDIQPDLAHTAQAIGEQCARHFNGTFGVMQPTGDRWGVGEPGPWPRDSAYIDRICGSPWMGREFCRRINGGRGPMREEFRHMFVDEAMQEIALKYGLLWQRRDLIHYHRHWARKPGTEMSMCPDFLMAVNTPEHWRESRELFNRLKAAGWPESDPIA